MSRNTATREAVIDVAEGLRTYADTLERNGEDPTFLRDFQTSLRDYAGFGERIAGDAIRKIDYVLWPKVSALAEGGMLELEGVTLSHAKREGDVFSVTAVDPEGVQRFRIHWRQGHKPDVQADASEKERVSVMFQSCPPDDPQYEYAEMIASASLSRLPGDSLNTSSRGLLWAVNFFDFIDAMDVLRPALSGEIGSMPRQTPWKDLPFSFEEMDKMSVADIVVKDGGLPGAAARESVLTMLRERGTPMLASIAERSEQIALWLEGQGCVWGGAAQTTHGGDNVMYAVRSETGRLGLLFNARNNSGPYTVFLSSKNLENGTASLVAATGGRHVFRAVEAFLGDQTPDAPTATINLSTGEHDIGPAFVGTDILDLALCHLRFVEEDLVEIASGEVSERFEREDDFQFFIDANSAFYLDREGEEDVHVAAP
ncbi:hypothetical protein D3C71_258840 [compost metagenome]